MDIVIAGCGKVGGELAQQLSQEGHAVTVIDRNSRRVEEVGNLYDVMGVCGNCAVLSVQKEAQVDKADLLIASTASDEQNLLACLLARKLGTRHTIARVRDPEYIGQLSFLAGELGLSMHINPEYSAATEISRILRFPSAQKVDVFAGGRAEIVETTLPAGADLAGLQLRDIGRLFGTRILVCAVRREEEVFIPGGSFALREGDRISLTGEPKELAKLFRKWGVLRKKAEDVMIVGGSRTGYYLARLLLGMGSRVVLVEKDERRCAELCELLPEALVVCGDGADHELLGESDLAGMDGLVALTGSDEENIVLGLYAASATEGKVVVKVNNGNLIRLGEKAGLGSVVSPKHITADMILRYVRAMSSTLHSNVEALHSLCGGRAEALEFAAVRAPGVLGIPLKALKTRDNLLVACIIRGSKTIIPGGEDEIRAGDHVLVVTTEQGLDDLTDIIEK